MPAPGNIYGLTFIICHSFWSNDLFCNLKIDRSRYINNRSYEANLTFWNYFKSGFGVEVCGPSEGKVAAMLLLLHKTHEFLLKGGRHAIIVTQSSLAAMLLLLHKTHEFLLKGGRHAIIVTQNS